MTLEDSDLAPGRAGEERTLFPRSSSPPKCLFELERAADGVTSDCSPRWGPCLTELPEAHDRMTAQKARPMKNSRGVQHVNRKRDVYYLHEGALTHSKGY